MSLQHKHHLTATRRKLHRRVECSAGEMLAHEYNSSGLCTHFDDVYYSLLVFRTTKSGAQIVREAVFLKMFNRHVSKNKRQ